MKRTTLLLTTLVVVTALLAGCTLWPFGKKEIIKVTVVEPKNEAGEVLAKVTNLAKDGKYSAENLVTIEVKYTEAYAEEELPIGWHTDDNRIDNIVVENLIENDKVVGQKIEFTAGSRNMTLNGRLVPELRPGTAMFAFVNMNYNSGVVYEFSEITVFDLDKDEIAFKSDFVGSDDDPWNEEQYSMMHSSGSASSPDLLYTIDNGNGRVTAGVRREGMGSAYGRIVPTMEDLDNSEILMRLKVDNADGITHYLRVFLQADKFGSGSSYAENGYGIAIHFGKNEVTLQQRVDKSTDSFDTRNTGFSANQWHWIRLRAANGTVAVKSWKDGVNEPEVWDIVHYLPAF